MTARALPPERMPGWPRLLTAPLAAAYIGCGVNKLREYGAADPLFPRPVSDDHVQTERWDRQALDVWVDTRSRYAGRETSKLVDSILR